MNQPGVRLHLRRTSSDVPIFGFYFILLFYFEASTSESFLIKSLNNVAVSLPAHFHHVIELLRFRQGTLSGIFLSAGESCCVE